VKARLVAAEEMISLGLEVVGLSILAIKPTPETARALEAGAREQLFREADEAIYARRNSAAEQERAIKENELNTEIAVENKKRQIRETQMEAERAVQEKKQLVQKEALEANIGMEDRRKSLVALAAENAKAEADARAYGVETTSIVPREFLCLVRVRAPGVAAGVSHSTSDQHSRDRCRNPQSVITASSPSAGIQTLAIILRGGFHVERSP